MYDVRSTIYALRSRLYDLRSTIYALRSTLYDLRSTIYAVEISVEVYENALITSLLLRVENYLPLHRLYGTVFLSFLI